MWSDIRIFPIVSNYPKEAHNSWLAAMKCRDTSCEDVSPAEGFTACLNIIKDAIKQNGCLIDEK